MASHESTLMDDTIIDRQLQETNWVGYAVFFKTFLRVKIEN